MRLPCNARPLTRGHQSEGRHREDARGIRQFFYLTESGTGSTLGLWQRPGLPPVVWGMGLGRTCRGIRRGANHPRRGISDTSRYGGVRSVTPVRGSLGDNPIHYKRRRVMIALRTVCVWPPFPAGANLFSFSTFPIPARSPGAPIIRHYFPHGSSVSSPSLYC